MKKYIVVFLVFSSRLCLGVAVLKQHSPAPDCESVLDESPAVADLNDLLRLSDFEEFSADTTVRVSTSRHRLYGYNLKLLTRVGPVWESTHQSQPNAPEMDPRGFIIAMGPALAAEFGCRMLSDKQMLSTTPAVLNHVTQMASACLKRRSGIDNAFGLYFVTPKTRFLSNRQYVIYFIHSLVPMASNGSLYLHDLLHGLAFLIPRRFIEFAQFQARTMVNFEKFFLSRYPQLAQKPAVESFLNSLYDDEARRIDHGTGNFGMALGRKNFRAAALALGPLVEYGMSPANIITNLIQYSAIDQTLDRAQAKLLIAEFNEFSNRPMRGRKIDSHQDMYEDLTVTESEIKTRIETLDTALRMMKNH